MQIVFHVGLHKCASTYLQRIGFASHPEINLIWAEAKNDLKSLRLHGPGRGNQAYADYFFATYIQGKSGTPVVSNESLAGEMKSGCGGEETLVRLKQIFGPNIKILIILREQCSMLFSIWSQYIKEGGVLGLKDFLSRSDSPARPSNNQSIFTKLAYSNLVRFLYDNFEKQSVKICLFEEFKQQESIFLQDLYDFICVDKRYVPPDGVFKKGYSYNFARVVKELNRVFKTRHNPSGLLQYYKYFRSFAEKTNYWLPESRKPDVAGILTLETIEKFKGSNQLTSQLLDKDLARYGYLV